ncbi:MAG: hypothetical protein SFW65_08055 [Alphaproteobacteria bacterium]|nr:hypothetical protein [Alphaproteobacteria bacterium]
MKKIAAFLFVLMSASLPAHADVKLTADQFANFQKIAPGSIIQGTTAGVYDFTDKESPDSTIIATVSTRNALIAGDDGQTLVASPYGQDALSVANGTHITLKAGNNGTVMIGGTGDDTIIGGPGEDKIAGAGGADSIYGNGGDDTIVYEAHAIVIDGGGGVDTLIVPYGTEVDLKNTDNQVPGGQAIVTNFERVSVAPPQE